MKIAKNIESTREIPKDRLSPLDSWNEDDR